MSRRRRTPCAAPFASTTRSPSRGPAGMVICGRALSRLAVPDPRRAAARTACQARLALRLPRARRHAHPFELALPACAGGRGFLLLLRQPLLLLLEPGGVVALPRNAGAAIELEDPAGDVVEEVAVVRDGDHRARRTPAGSARATRPTRRRDGSSARRAAAGRAAAAGGGRAPRAGARRPRASCTSASPRRQPQRVHRDLERAVELPGVGGVDASCRRPCSASSFSISSSDIGSPSCVDTSSKRVSSARVAATRLLDVPAARSSSDRAAAPAAGSRWWSPSAGNASPAKSWSTPAMMRSNVLLPAPLAPSTPIFAPA